MATKTTITTKVPGDKLKASEFNQLNDNFNISVDELNGLSLGRDLIKLDFVNNIAGSYRFNPAYNNNYCFLSSNGKTFQASVIGSYFSHLRQGSSVIKKAGTKKVILPVALSGDKTYLLDTAILAPDNDSSIQKTEDNFETKNQYIHPSIAYSATAINGYNYFCFVSNYPRENPRYEDDDLLVSADGLNWTRVLPTSDAGLPQLPPNAFNVTNDYGRENSFVPIPAAGTEITMNGVSFAPARTLKHDPEVVVDGGYVYLYNFYNFYETDGSGSYDVSKYHRFVVVFRTNNLRDWEICRTDGTTIDATSANILEIFTQSSVDEKNNYIRYFAWNNNPSEGDSNMQIVHDTVADIWYAYIKEYGNYTNSNMGFKRYTGTSLLNFDWDNPVYCVADKLSRSTEHPDIFYENGKYYHLTSEFIHESSDGINFTEQTYTPFPTLPAGLGYKADACVGANGNLLVMFGCLPRSYNKPTQTTPYTTGRDVCTAIFKFSSFADMLAFAKTGKDFASIAASITVYPVTGTAIVYNKTIRTANTSWTAIELCEHEFNAGDEVVVTILSSVQGTATAQFGDVIIE